MRYALALALLVACAPRERPVFRTNSDSARAAEAERDLVGTPRAETPETRQLERVIHDLAVAITNVRSHAGDTADAPRWTSILDAIADEMPVASDSDPRYAAAYQHTKDAIWLARQDRLAEAYAYTDTAFKLLR